VHPAPHGRRLPRGHDHDPDRRDPVDDEHRTNGDRPERKGEHSGGATAASSTTSRRFVVRSLMSGDRAVYDEAGCDGRPVPPHDLRSRLDLDPSAEGRASPLQDRTSEAQRTYRGPSPEQSPTLCRLCAAATYVPDRTRATKR
jgi:hypothetical protein